MQEEIIREAKDTTRGVANKTIAFAIQTARMTNKVLNKLIQKYLNDRGNKSYQGRQSLKKLYKQNNALTNIEISEKNIKSFEKVAKKYNIDFALKKDKTITPPRYIVFFKSRDVDILNRAFKEFTNLEINKSKKTLGLDKNRTTDDLIKITEKNIKFGKNKKTPILEKLKMFTEITKSMSKDKIKNKHQDLSR